MMTRPWPGLALAAALLCFSACRSREAPAQWPAFVKDFVENSLALSPVSATAAGYHAHGPTALDTLLDDLSPEGLARQRTHWNSMKAQLAKFDLAALDPEQRADAELIAGQIDSALLELDVLQGWKNNPTVYVEMIGSGLFAPYSLEYAPVEERFNHIIARMQAIPAVVSAARRNLGPAPAIWKSVAVEENGGNIALLEKTFPERLPPALRSRYEEALRIAVPALKELNTLIESLPDAGPDAWRLGKEKYGRKFRAVFGEGLTPEKALAEAETALTEIRREMFRLSLPLHAKLYPTHRDPVDVNLIVGEVLARIAERRPARENFFDEARKSLAEARAFLDAHQKELVESPFRDNLQIIETPPFMRGVYGVGGFNPAPPLEPNLGAYYWVTPIPAQWTREQAESKLREYNDYGLRLLTIHETIPGHYIQFEYANSVEPPPRRLLRALYGSPVYVEGWAVYATGRMLAAGYLDRSPELQITFYKQLLRAVANAILDIRLHTLGMTQQEALDLMTSRTFQEREEAQAKLRRAMLTSCQLPTYYAGYREWSRLREDYARLRGESFSPAEFHGRALKAGALPLATLRRLLGIDATPSSK
jgi:uncharacterized protein (DUF885 family)